MKKARPLFSRTGLKHLEKIAREKTLIAFDLDGTLVPIIRDFKKVRLDRRTRDVLNRLAASYKVAIVSGRSRRDVLSRVGMKKRLSIIGNHGLEGLLHATETKEVKAWEAELRKNLKGFPGTVIENKKYSLTVHYRLSADKRRVRARILETLSGFRRAPRVILGKDVFNLMPDLGVNKGTAVVDLIKKLNCRFGIFVGDDITDEDVFALGNRRLMTIKVGSPRKTMAQYFVKRQRDVYRIASRIADVSK